MAGEPEIWICLIVAAIIVFIYFIYQDSKSKEVIIAKREQMLPDADDEYTPRVRLPKGQTSRTLYQDGYSGPVSWTEVIKASELDPSIYANHRDFVKDVRVFSSGANFTSVTDDNTSPAFTNFQGLRRPQHVPVGADARQQISEDETVLQRNRGLYW